MFAEEDRGAASMQVDHTNPPAVARSQRSSSHNGWRRQLCCTEQGFCGARGLRGLHGSEN